MLTLMVCLLLTAQTLDLVPRLPCTDFIFIVRMQDELGEPQE